MAGTNQKNFNWLGAFVDLAFPMLYPFFALTIYCFIYINAMHRDLASDRSLYRFSIVGVVVFFPVKLVPFNDAATIVTLCWVGIVIECLNIKTDITNSL